MFGLFDCCSPCKSCVTFTPPSGAQVALPWDILTVEMTRTKFVLRRCSLVTIPLTGSYRGYTTGQVIPYYQPGDAGPPLIGDGSRQTDADRRISLTHGLNLENPIDGTTPEGELGGSRQPGQSEPEVWKHTGFKGNPHPTRSVKYGVNDVGGNIETPSGAESYPRYLRVSQPDALGVRHACFEVGGYDDGSYSPFYKFVRWDLASGEPVVRAYTSEAADNNSATSSSSPVGNRTAVGPSKIVKWFISDSPYQTGWVEIDLTAEKHHHWVTKTEANTNERNVGWGVATEPVPVCWCWDQSDYFLEIESPSTSQQIAIFRNGPEGREKLLDKLSDHTSGGRKAYPIAYQKREGLHVFALDDGWIYYRDECGTEWDYDTGELVYFVNILANGQIAFISSQGVRAINNDGSGLAWSINRSSASGAAVIADSCNVTQETYYGAIHVRGVPIDSPNYYDTGDYLAGYNPGASFVGTDRRTLSMAWSVSPASPSLANAVVGAQEGFDNTTSEWDADYDFRSDVPSGRSQILHFVGHDMTRFDSVQTAVETFPSSMTDSSLDGLFVGAVAAPAPGNYGVG